MCCNGKIIQTKMAHPLSAISRGPSLCRCLGRHCNEIEIDTVEGAQCSSPNAAEGFVYTVKYRN